MSHPDVVSRYEEIWPCRCRECLVEALVKRYQLLRSRSGKVHILKDDGDLACLADLSFRVPISHEPDPDQFCQNCLYPIEQEALFAPWDEFRGILRKVEL